jgi:hypothetical protein
MIIPYFPYMSIYSPGHCLSGTSSISYVLKVTSRLRSSTMGNTLSNFTCTLCRNGRAANREDVCGFRTHDPFFAEGCPFRSYTFFDFEETLDTNLPGSLPRHLLNEDRWPHVSRWHPFVWYASFKFHLIFLYILYNRCHFMS